MGINELTDGFAQLLNTAEGASVKSPALEAGKPALDGVQTGGAGALVVARRRSTCPGRSGGCGWVRPS
jgi:hypothetical protein